MGKVLTTFTSTSDGIAKWCSQKDVHNGAEEEVVQAMETEITQVNKTFFNLDEYLVG